MQTDAQPSLSVIIPTLNEEAYLDQLLHQFRNLPFRYELIISDGGSSDRTLEIAKAHQAILLQGQRGRGAQLAAGANEAKADHLLFLHADVFFATEDLLFIQDMIKKNIPLASFRIRFDLSHWFLKLNAYFSRFPHPYFHFGDQGLWISKKLYQKVGGFDPSKLILEDQDLYGRAAQWVKPEKRSEILSVSARKYRDHGVFKLQFKFYQLWLAYKLGSSAESLATSYQRFLRSNKPNDT